MKWYTITADEIRRLHSDNWIPQEGGCYAIYADGRLIYIGCTENLRKRMKSHIALFGMSRQEQLAVWIGEKKMVIRDWTIKVRPARYWGEWATLEIRLIRRLQPPHNTRGIKRRSA